MSASRLLKARHTAHIQRGWSSLHDMLRRIERENVVMSIRVSRDPPDTIDVTTLDDLSAGRKRFEDPGVSAQRLTVEIEFVKAPSSERGV